MSLWQRCSSSGVFLPIGIAFFQYILFSANLKVRSWENRNLSFNSCRFLQTGAKSFECRFGRNGIPFRQITKIWFLLVFRPTPSFWDWMAQDPWWCIPGLPDGAETFPSGIGHNYTVLMGAFGGHFGVIQAILGPFGGLRERYWSYLGVDSAQNASDRNLWPLNSPHYYWPPKGPKWLQMAQNYRKIIAPEFCVFMACSNVNNLEAFRSFRS